MLLRQLASEKEERQRRLQSLPQHARSAQIEEASEIKAASVTTEQTDKEICKLITQVEAVMNVSSLQQTKMTEQQCQCTAKAPEKRRRLSQLKQGKVETCNHCFLCGEEGHRAVGCLNRQKRSAPSTRPKSAPQTAVPTPGSPCHNYT